MRVVADGQVERAAQHVDQLGVGLERVGIVAASTAGGDRGLDHLEGSLPTRGEDDVLDVEPAEVHDLALGPADDVGARPLEQGTDPDVEELADSQERPDRGVRLVAFEEADEAVGQIGRRGQLGDRHAASPPGLPEPRADAGRMDGPLRLLGVRGTGRPVGSHAG